MDTTSRGQCLPMLALVVAKKDHCGRKQLPRSKVAPTENMQECLCRYQDRFKRLSLMELSVLRGIKGA